MSPCCFLRRLDFSTSDARDGSVRRDRGARTEAAARGAMQSVLALVARLADSVSSDPGAGRKGELQRESGPFQPQRQGRRRCRGVHLYSDSQKAQALMGSMALTWELEKPPGGTGVRVLLAHAGSCVQIAGAASCAAERGLECHVGLVVQLCSLDFGRW